LLSWIRAFTIKQAAWVRHGALKWRQRQFRRGSYFIWFAVRPPASFLGETLFCFVYLHFPHILTHLPNICRLWPGRRLAAVADGCRTARTYDAPCIKEGSPAGLRLGWGFSFLGKRTRMTVSVPKSHRSRTSCFSKKYRCIKKIKIYTLSCTTRMKICKSGKRMTKQWCGSLTISFGSGAHFPPSFGSGSEKKLRIRILLD
jgi:hypothetical protein